MNDAQWASEEKLAEALNELLRKCDEFQIDLLLIGAFAVRAYTPKRHRLTTDLDFVVPRASQNQLASVFESLGYQYTHRARFGGSQAVRLSEGRKIQIDVSIGQINDMSTGLAYKVPLQTFREKKQVEVLSLYGDSSVDAYALPLSDLLITKLMTSRDHDAADVIVLLAEGLSSDIVDDIKSKAQVAELTQRINVRLAELVSFTENKLRSLTNAYAGERLQGYTVQTFRKTLRQLRMPRDKVIYLTWF